MSVCVSVELSWMWFTSVLLPRSVIANEQLATSWPVSFCVWTPRDGPLDTVSGMSLTLPSQVIVRRSSYLCIWYIYIYSVAYRRLSRGVHIQEEAVFLLILRTRGTVTLLLERVDTLYYVHKPEPYCAGNWSLIYLWAGWRVVLCIQDLRCPFFRRSRLIGR